jgi:hypothetical protein
VPPGTPDAVMAQTGTGKKKKKINSMMILWSVGHSQRGLQEDVFKDSNDYIASEFISWSYCFDICMDDRTQ